MTTKLAIDPVNLSVIGGALQAVPREMGINLIKTAYSSIVREARDLSTAIFDGKGQVVAQSEHIPILLSAVAISFEKCARIYDISQLKPDEVIINNDPFNGGQHMHDIAVYLPVFSGRGELIAFAGSIAHHLDMGGISSGTIVGSTEIYQEGLRIPPLKVTLKEGHLPPILEEIIKANVRASSEIIGDLNAQLACGQVARTRLNHLTKKYGKDMVLSCMDQLILHSEKLTRDAIRKIPDGIYKGESFLDNDGVVDEQVPIRVTIQIQDTDIEVDFSESAPQRKGSVNAPLASTLAGTHTAIRHILLTEKSIPANAGCYKPIKVIAPPGTVVNPLPPAAVHSRILTAYRVYEAIMQAFAKFLPRQVIACGHDSSTCTSITHRGKNRYAILSEVIAGGWGAGYNHDGADALPFPLSNCSNVPAEYLETRFRFLRLRKFALVPDSCGHGMFRGGLGEVREFEVLGEDVEFAGFSDRHKYPSPGLFGGSGGMPGSFYITRDGKKERLSSKTHISLRKGDIFTIVGGGGGGYGNPRERDKALVLKDLREGKISVKIASQVYGLSEREIQTLQTAHPSDGIPGHR